MKIERKMMVIGLSCLLVSIAVGSAYAVTRTIQSNKETISGGTYFYSGNYDWITGSHFNLSSKITNSKGHVWNATGANIKLAIYDLGNTTGGKVWIPPGTFYFTSTIYLTNKTSIIGAGQESTVLKAGTGYASTVGLLSKYPGNNITIKDMTINMNDTNSGFYFSRTRNITIQNVCVRDIVGNGFYFSNNCTGIIMSDVRIYNVSDIQGIGIRWSNDSVFNNIVFINGSGTANCAIDASTGCKNLTFNNIVIKDYQRGIKTTYNNGTMFNNIFIENAVGTYGMDIQYAHHCTVNNIMVRGSSFSISGSDHVNVNNLDSYNSATYGLVISTSSRFVNVNNAIIRYSTNQPLSIGTSNNFTLNNVQVLNPTTYSYITTCKDFRLSNCNFMSSASYGIDLVGNNQFMITGCIFELNTNYAIITSLGAPNHNYTISDCIFRSNSNGIYMADDTNVTITGCRFLKNTNAAIHMETTTRNVVVTNCVMTNNMNGFELSATRNLLVSNCIIDRSTGSGVYTVACHNYSFVNCQVLNGAGIGFNLGADSNLTISCCRIYGNSGDGIECDALDSVFIVNCIMWGQNFDDNIVGSHNMTGSAYNIGMTII